MVNKVWDIVNQDRIKPPQPDVHELGEEVATPEAIAAMTPASAPRPCPIALSEQRLTPVPCRR